MGAWAFVRRSNFLGIMAKLPRYGYWLLGLLRLDLLWQVLDADVNR